jgi:hypothetical protein
LIIGPIFSPVADACGMVVSCGRGTLVLLELERQDRLILKGFSLSEFACEVKESRKVWSHE